MKKILLCSLITLSVFAADGPDVGTFVDRAPETKELTIKVDDEPLSFDPAILNKCGAFKIMCQSFGHEDHKVIPEEALQSIVQDHVLKGLTYDQAKKFVDILNLENADEVHKHLAQYILDLESKDKTRKKQVQSNLLALYQKADYMDTPLLQKICAKLIEKTCINVDRLPPQLSSPIMQKTMRNRVNHILLGLLGYQQAVFDCGSWVNSAVFSPDGKYIALVLYDNIIRIWDAGSGVDLHALQGHISSVNSVAFSPDGERIASASRDGTVCIWNTETGVCLHTLRGHNFSVNSVAFSSDGKYIASASEDKIVRIWDTEIGSCLHALEGHTHWVNSVTFSPEDKCILSASRDGTIRIWDVVTGTCLHILTDHTHWVYAAVFSPDGKRIASASHDGTIRIWDAETNICLHTLTDHNGCVYAAMFSPDSKYIASASEDKTVRIWDAGAGVCLYTLQDHTHWVGSVSFSPDGKRIASASLDNTVRIWQDYNCLLKKCPQELIELFDKARISWQKRKPYRITVNEEHIINKYDQHSVVKLLKDERLFIKSNKQKCCIQ